MPPDSSLTDAELAVLIDTITAEVVTQLEQSGYRTTNMELATQNTTDDDLNELLVIITQVEKHLIPFLGMLQEVMRERCTPLFVIHDDARALLQQHGVASDKCYCLEDLEAFIPNLDRYSSIILATPLINLLTRVLALEDDDPIVRVILRALMNDVRVIAISDAMIPDPSKLSERGIPLPSKSSLNSPFQQPQTLPEMIHERIERFTKFGVSIVPLALLDQLLGGNSLVVTERVITEKEILELHSSTVRELRVPKQTIITPLANDRAKELGISIIRSG